jgi:hypothetical protein
VPLADYLAGLGFLAVTAGAALAAGVLLQARRLPHLRGVPRVLAVAVLATAALVAAHLLPGVLGILSRWTAAAAAVVLAAIAWRVRERRHEAPGAARPRPAEAEPPLAEPEGLVSWILGGGAAAAVSAWVVASAWNRTVLPTEDLDTMSFHFPVVGKWIQSGTFWRVDQFTPLLPNGNYPQTGDVVFLAAIQPWRNDWLAGAVNPLFILLTGAAVYAVARELGALRPHALLGAALLVSMPVVGAAANGSGMTDSMFYACLGAAILFLLRHERGAPRAELWLAVLALGLAFGTKWYSLFAVPSILAVWLGARLLARRDRRGTLRTGALAAGAVAAVGGFWLVRNLVETDNPFYPADVRVLGVTLFDSPHNFIAECAGFTIAHYVGDRDAWIDYILPVYRDGYAWPGIAIAAGFLAALVVAGLRRAPAPRGRLGAGVALAGLMTVGYAITPFSAFGPEGEPNTAGASIRYLVPALLVAAPMAAWALSRAGRARHVLELAAVAAVAQGIVEAFDVRLRVVVLVMVAIAVLAAAAVGAELLLRRAGARLARLAVVAVAVLGAVALVAVGHGRQREFNEARYARDVPPIAWIAQNAPEGSRIALAGAWGVGVTSPVWPSFGERLDNHVEFLGPTVDGQLREYPRRDRWAAALRRGRYGLLVVGRGGYAEEDCPVPGQHSDDDAWARAEGFEVLARSDRLTLYRVR